MVISILCVTDAEKFDLHNERANGYYSRTFNDIGGIHPRGSNGDWIWVSEDIAISRVDHVIRIKPVRAAHFDLCSINAA